MRGTSGRVERASAKVSKEEDTVVRIGGKHLQNNRERGKGRRGETEQFF